MLAPRASTLLAEWRPLSALVHLVGPWQALAARAAEPNVFYEPAFALAAAPVLGPDVGAILVWSDRELLGLMPAGIARRRYGAPLALLAGWTHPFAPLGVPLIDRDAPELVVDAMLEQVAGNPAMPDLLLLSMIPEDGVFAKTLMKVLARRGGRVATFGQHQRALLAPGADRTAYLDAALGRKKRKELARQRRRLAETGALAFGMARTSEAVTQALPAFLDLEAAGWKGRAGSAASQHADIQAFMQRAVTALAAEGKASGACLSFNGKPIAAGLTLMSGDAAWFWKVAYDETQSRASPGVQLALDLTEALLADPAVARVDSCATADHPMIDHIWRERLSLADMLVAVGPQAARSFAIASRLEALRRSGIAAAKRLRDLVRR